MPNQFLASVEGDIESYFITEYWLIDQYVGDTLWTWGSNSAAQTGTNSNITKSTPVTTFSGGTTWKQVACGDQHTAAVKTDGTLWVWGYNFYGQLGNNTTLTRSTPVTIFSGATNWKQVACGKNHTASVRNDGTLWSWGRNNGGQLGTSDTTDRSTPTVSYNGTADWIQVSCGYSHTSAIKADGTLWTWGDNSLGQLGTYDLTTRCTPVTTYAGETNWKQVACGNYHTAAIKTDGTLWIWGTNSAGQLGTSDTTDRSTPVTTFSGGTNWKQVACGTDFTLAIKADGTLWTWGNNSLGQLGTYDLTTRCTPVTTYAGGTNWKQSSGGGSHSAVIKSNGTLWGWGFNTTAQLGAANDTATRCTPVMTYTGGTNWKQVSSGGSHTAAVTSGSDPLIFVS
jgi:alpha-tubulin suppressor-like RCC1 family protein